MHMHRCRPPRCVQQWIYSTHTFNKSCITPSRTLCPFHHCMRPFSRHREDHHILRPPTRPRGKSGRQSTGDINGDQGGTSGYAAYLRISKLLYFRRYTSPRRYAFNSLSGRPVRKLVPTRRQIPGEGLNMGSNTMRLHWPLFRLSNPTMVKECPKEHQFVRAQGA